MKKILFGLVAVVLAIGFTAFTEIKEAKRTSIEFHFIPADDSEELLEVATNWNDFPSGVVCPNGSDPCKLVIDNSEFIYGGTTNEQKLAAYLAAQGTAGSEYASAMAAVNALRTALKP